MWTRKELKEKGKGALKRNYWKCVLMAVILHAITFGASASFSAEEGNIELLNQLSEASGISVGALIGIFAGIGLSVILISILWHIFLTIPLSTGVDRFFIVNTEDKAGLGEIGYSYKKERLFKTIGATLLVDLFVALWTILLIVPGIIKAYEYRMISYILADDPQLSAMDCLRRSKEMMKGHKWNTFVLDLSFIGWELLSTITCGIAGVFYVNPYFQATNAELYKELKKGMEA